MIALYSWNIQVHGISDEQYRVVERMGQLNGVALQCHYFEATRRMKRGLVTALPKRRQLGQAFDDVTNEAFLAFIENKSVCPEEADFYKEVEETINLLNQVFSAE